MEIMRSKTQVQWVYPELDPKRCAMFARDLCLPPVVAKILVARGFRSVDDVRRFLYPQLTDLHSPTLFSEMTQAVDRILLARERNEHVLIYGDSDVDGMTGVALLLDFLRSINMRVDCVFFGATLKQKGTPHDLIQSLKERSSSLLITVDCGITAGKEIAAITKKGIDVIVTDHHLPTGKIPHCIATLNPQLKDHHYANQYLTGVGVAFKLACGVAEALYGSETYHAGIELRKYLDLVALGTLTDVGVVQQENRTLVQHGLRVMREKRRFGLRKLCQLAGVEDEEISSSDVVLKVAPKLNSIGRLSNPVKGVELLLSQDVARCAELIKDIDQINRQRRKIEGEVFADIQRMIMDEPTLVQDAAIVLVSSNWHARIIPIIAAKLAKIYNKPVVIIAVSDGFGKGSLRTTGSFPLSGVLKKCAPLLESFGGHEFAAGIILQEGNIDTFKKRFIHFVKSSIRKSDTEKRLYLDAEANFASINHDLLSSLELLEPFGRENPTPLLYTRAYQGKPPRLLPGNHLKLFLSQEDRDVEAMAFGCGHRIEELRSHRHAPIDVVYSPKISSSSARGGLQLLVQDFCCVL